MARTAIRDQRNFIIGYIEDTSNGDQRALDIGYRIVGYYDAASDRTKDTGFRIVGMGNQLVGLIERAR
jgi:hypothetical protein